jgi:hypothetical protein
MNRQSWLLARLLTCFPALMGAGSLHAQMFPDSLAAPVTTQASFERNINTFTWDLGGRAFGASAGARILAEERFLRNLIRTDRDYLKDEQNFFLLAGFRISEDWELQGSVRNFFFSDQRTRGLNDITSNTPLLGASWRPLRELRVSSFMGWSFDRQQGLLDQGFAYRLDAVLQNLAMEDVRVSGEVFSSADFISPRMEQDHRVSGTVATLFVQAGDNTVTAGFRSTRRDFYLSTLTTPTGRPPIESRVEQQLGFSDVLRLNILENTELQVTGALAERNIARNVTSSGPIPVGAIVYPSDISEFRLDAGALLRFQRPSTTVAMRLDFSERTETHTIEDNSGGTSMDYLIRKELESQKNTAIQQTLFAISAQQNLSACDSVSITASTLKMRYDTPSSLNLDDRDELYVLGNLRWTRCFSPHFLTSLVGAVTLRHTVYIWSQRSANNTWNRVFRLAPSTEVRLPWLVSRNGGDVIANYTVYDFELPGELRQSYSLRQLTLTDSSEVSLFSRRIWAVVHAHLRFYERGELFWSDFTMRPISAFSERTIAVFLEYRAWEDDSGQGVRAAAGLRSFTQDRFDVRNNQRVHAGTLRTWGPAARLAYHLDHDSMVLTDGWYQITDATGTFRNATPNVQIQLIWTM